MDASPKELLNRLEAAEFLGISRFTLAAWATRGHGPKYTKLGRRLVRYRREDLESFVAQGSVAHAPQTVA